MTRPSPLIPADCDLSGLNSMMLDAPRLRRSRLALVAKRRPELGWHSVMLWGAAWCESPVASIEDDDDVLADRAMLSHERWIDLKADLLAPWVLCTNGRWYHPVVAEKANALWADRLRKRHDLDNARTRKKWKADKKEGDPPMMEFEPWVERNYPATFAMLATVLAAKASVTDKKDGGKSSGTEGETPAAAPDTGEGLAAKASVTEQNPADSTLKGKVKVKQKENVLSVEPKGSTGASAGDGFRPAWWPQRDRYGRVVSDVTEKLVFDTGKIVLGKNAGGQLVRLKKTYGFEPDAWRSVLDLVMQADEKADPAEWFAKVVRNAEVDEFPLTAHEKFPEAVYTDR